MSMLLIIFVPLFIQIRGAQVQQKVQVASHQMDSRQIGSRTSLVDGSSTSSSSIRCLKYSIQYSGVESKGAMNKGRMRAQIVVLLLPCLCKQVKQQRLRIVASFVCSSNHSKISLCSFVQNSPSISCHDDPSIQSYTTISPW